MWAIIIKNDGLCSILQGRNKMGWFFDNTSPKLYKHLGNAVKKQRSLAQWLKKCEIWVINTNMFPDGEINCVTADRVITKNSGNEKKIIL